MEYLVKFQLNIYALIVLIILLITVYKKSHIKNTGRLLFLYAIFLTIAVIIIEPLTWIFDGMHFFGAYFLEYFTNFLLILIAPFICGVMLSYVDFFIFKDHNRIKKRFFYMQPSLFTIIMLIINFFHPIYFSVDTVNVGYHSEDLLWVHYLMVVSYYIFMIVFTYIHRKRTYRFAISIFIIFFSIPFIGMAVQLFLDEFFFSWTSIALSLLVVYIFLESTTGEKDYLTKLYSRQSYEKYICHLIDSKKDFSILFLDLDNFKNVNDTAGHFEGDKVLIQFGEVLEKVFYPNTMISRLGGDEFIVVLEFPMVIEDTINAIYHVLKNHKNKNMHELKFSYGFQECKENMNIDQLYVKVDKKMYENKHTKTKTVSN